HEVADEGGRDVLVEHLVQLRLDAAAELLDLLLRDRPLLARLQDPGQELRAIERHSAAVLLDHAQVDLLDRLVGGEATAAAEAFASAPDHGRVARGARVDDLVVVGLAVRATHSRPAPRPPPPRSTGQRRERWRRRERQAASAVPSPVQVTAEVYLPTR